MECLHTVHDDVRFPYPVLPPELFPIIASFIPKSCAPSTLLSLASANHGFCRLVLPLLYERLFLKTEDDALAVFQRILEQPQLGMAVKELYVLSSLSLATRNGERAFDAVTGLRKIVEKGLVPRLAALGIYLTPSWHKDQADREIVGFGHLPTEFWKDLHSHSPRLRTIILRNVGETNHDPWIDRTIAEDINMFTELSNLSLQFPSSGIRFSWSGVSQSTGMKILANLPQIAPSLQRLTLRIRDSTDATPILNFCFPNLKSISLLRCVTGEEHEIAPRMAFWRQHPQLESISITSSMGRWFADDIESSFLPNLKHLKASFENVRALAPILHRLQSLSVTRSYNAQVPYLVRAVLPSGLPNLKSLEIMQKVYADTFRKMRRMEGGLWYEAPDGTFCEVKRQSMMYRSMIDGYIHSIVRGVPNLEELAIHDCEDSESLSCGGPEDMETLAPQLAEFSALERFYLSGFSFEQDSPLDSANDLGAEFLSSAKSLACVCARLTSVTALTVNVFPYVAAKIERGSDGTVNDVRLTTRGVGMLIPEGEHDPFPFNPPW